jgi:hypothetical protein
MVASRSEKHRRERISLMWIVTLDGGEEKHEMNDFAGDDGKRDFSSSPSHSPRRAAILRLLGKGLVRKEYFHVHVH